MRKRVMSLILAIAMIFAMIPESAFASNEMGGKLIYRIASWDANDEGINVPVEDESGELKDHLTMQEYSGEYAFFYFIDADGTQIRVESEELESSDEEILGLGGLDNTACVWLSSSAAGTAYYRNNECCNK